MLDLIEGRDERRATERRQGGYDLAMAVWDTKSLAEIRPALSVASAATEYRWWKGDDQPE
ncbi:MAG TPA: hypothetical protein VIU37_12705 [Candidatus Limnocylindrales bacterium]